MTTRNILITLGIFVSIHSHAQVERLLYVAEDHGFVYVYNINDNHRLLRKFEVPGTGSYKGVSADPKRGKLYLSSYQIEQEKRLDSFSIDGKYVYPSCGDVIDAQTKKIVARVVKVKK